MRFVTPAFYCYPVAYPGGALICEVIYEKEGNVGINKLARGKTKDFEEIISLAKNILNITEAETLELIERENKGIRINKTATHNVFGYNIQGLIYSACVNF